ncbi:MAG: hypothetical protein QOE15_999, partial [Acidimicrobiaceae bacterium]|nr:hypothetical protein [Acidimicrobiaceae bacterium]
MGITRRQLLSAGAVGAVGAAGVVIGGLGFDSGRRPSPAGVSPSKGAEPF